MKEKEEKEVASRLIPTQTKISRSFYTTAYFHLKPCLPYGI